MARSILLLLVLIGLADARAATVGDPPAWPLDLDTRYLTGNFMEPRGGRFHTGLDLKTNSRTGYAVVAVRDGWISRVRYAPGGYGKAIYLRGDDGLTYVYGHLDRLDDELRAHVRAQQIRRGAYEVDLTFAAGAWPVARGAVLALSGQSGTLGPHLHFEVRGADGSPRDPQAHGFAVADTIAPEILAVRAVDLAAPGAPTLIWGDGEVPLDGRLPDLFTAQGRLRFTALVVERSDHLRYRLGAWRLRLLLDGREVFASCNEELEWRRNRQQRLEYVRTPLGRERWLWRDARVTLAGREAAAGFGEEALPPGRHRLRLEAEDRAGNRSAVEWDVEVDPTLPADLHRGWRPDSFVQPEPWLVDASGPEPAGGVYAGVEPPVQWRRGRPEQELPGRRLELAGLVPVTAPVHFRVAGRALFDPVAVPWPPTAGAALVAVDDPAVAVYRLDEDGWSYETSLRGAEGVAVFDLDRPGVHGLMRDTAAPVIAVAPVETTLERGPPRRRHGISLPRWPVLRIPVGDHGSGVDWSTLEARLDGEVLIVEPDPPRDRILVELPDELAAGSHQLTVAVADRAGQERRETLILELREPPEG